jgi:SRSO17 transposase
MTIGLLIEDMAALKKGTCSVGVKRERTSTAGRIENSQAAVFLAYATAHEYAVENRETGLPRG